MKDRDHYLEIVDGQKKISAMLVQSGGIGACCHGDNEEKVYTNFVRQSMIGLKYIKKMVNHYPHKQ